MEQKKNMYGFKTQFNHYAFNFTGFSVCHPLYDDGVVLSIYLVYRLNIVRYAIHSSFSTEIATATSVLLPNFKGLTASAFKRILR